MKCEDGLWFGQQLSVYIKFCDFDHFVGVVYEDVFAVRKRALSYRHVQSVLLTLRWFRYELRCVNVWEGGERGSWEERVRMTHKWGK